MYSDGSIAFRFQAFLSVITVVVTGTVVCARSDSSAGVLEYSPSCVSA